MGEEEMCNTTLGLGLGIGVGVGSKRGRQVEIKSKRALWLNLSLPLHPKKEASDGDEDEESLSSKTVDDQEEEEEEVRWMKRNDCGNDYNNGGSRKKLKLTKEQITLLEDSFKLHSTLNTGQKQVLAKKLNLLPRQIEVWFQNRRARTKLKQIEQECELLKKCCESLSDENRRLKKELQELHCCSLKLDHQQPQPPPSLPFYIQFPKAAMCQSCEKFGKPSHHGGGLGEMKNAMAAAAVKGSMVQLHDISNNSNTAAAAAAAATTSTLYRVKSQSSYN